MGTAEGSLAFKSASKLLLAVYSQTRASFKAELPTAIASLLAKEQMASSKTAGVEKHTRVEEPDTCLPQSKLEALATREPLESSSELAKSAEGRMVAEVANTVVEKDTWVLEIHIAASAVAVEEQPVSRLAVGKSILRAPTAAAAEASIH